MQRLLNLLTAGLSPENAAIVTTWGEAQLPELFQAAQALARPPYLAEEVEDLITLTAEAVRELPAELAPTVARQTVQFLAKHYARAGFEPFQHLVKDGALDEAFRARLG